MNETRDIVFQELFFFGLEYADDFATVGRVRACETEIELLPICGNRAQSKLGSAIFIFREWFRIDDVESQFALRTLGELLQKLTDALRIGAQLRRILALILREEEIQIHWFLQ